LRFLSIALVAAAGCSVHLGTLPPGTGWHAVAVEAPVVEPGVDEALRRSLERALVARSALGDAALPVRVIRADWTPSGRSGTTVLYTATLEAWVGAGGGFSVVASVERSSPGDAAAARSARARAFADLADEVAQRVVGRLVLAQDPR
jgi:hypothetical protein